MSLTLNSIGWAKDVQLLKHCYTQFTCLSNNYEIPLDLKKIYNF